MKRNSKIHDPKGAALIEFAAAFLLLVVFFFIPLVNLSFIALRYFIAEGAIQEFAHRLALTDKRSESYANLAGDSFWSDFCRGSGIEVNSSKLELVICGANSGEELRLQEGERVPDEWLPGGSKAPCIYTYDLSARITIPAIYNGGPPIPAVSAPLQIKIDGRSAFENLSRNPASTEYFINE
ncbi:MAG: hypothetical protein K2X27_23180 [Candidatus Obscuribacterales bacterium]|nr:hypothetical protein [Candidatus Obscuribacterales bacterium]